MKEKRRYQKKSILFIGVCKKNKNFEFYEVKPYMENWEKKGNGWHLAGPDRRKLNELQLKKFREMLKNGLSVYVIYYDRFIYKKKKRKPKLTIHKHTPNQLKALKRLGYKGNGLNPREVTCEMLKNLDATDPDVYFGWDQEYFLYNKF